MELFYGTNRFATFYKEDTLLKHLNWQSNRGAGTQLDNTFGVQPILVTPSCGSGWCGRMGGSCNHQHPPTFQNLPLPLLLIPLPPRLEHPFSSNRAKRTRGSVLSLLGLPSPSAGPQHPGGHGHRRPEPRPKIRAQEGDPLELYPHRRACGSAALPAAPRAPRGRPRSARTP